MKIRSISQLDLSILSDSGDKKEIERPWENELIYFLLVDRFHDGKNRVKTDYVSNGKFIQDKEQLMKRYGGTFNGIRTQLTYLQNIGITCIWISPVFDNYENTYHGYAIRNFMEVDRRFGTVEELKELITEAHQIGIRIVLDIVINHTADTWSYKKENPIYTGKTYSFGKWNDTTFPLPHEFRNPSYYKKMGAIQHWDNYPETQEGDIFELKKLIIDESLIGKEVVNHLIKIYSYWIKELNVDGYRLDTVKHITPEAIAYFCSDIRKYAEKIGNNDFKIIGETVGDDTLIGDYIGTTKTYKGIQHGIDKALDFPLHFILKDVLIGEKPVSKLYDNFESKMKMLEKTEKNISDLVVFLDNHDQIGEDNKSRIGYSLNEQQMTAAVGFLFFMYGIPCLYYGTEQHFKGNGNHDCFLREPMFDQNSNNSFHNESSYLYKELSILARLRKELSIFYSINSLELDLISVNKSNFRLCKEVNDVIYWSKGLLSNKLILLFNPNKSENKQVCIKLTSENIRIGGVFEYVYGGDGEIKIEIIKECGYITIDLNPFRFVILKYKM